MTAGRAYYENGPKDGQLLLADGPIGQLLGFDVGAQASAYYRLTDRTREVRGRTYPVAEYFGPLPPAQSL